MCWASIRNGKQISDGCEYTLSYDECLPVCVPSWVSQSGLDLPATRAQHKRRNQVARQAGSQLVTHFDQLESSRVSQVATVATFPPCLPLLLLPLPLHDYRASIFAKPELRICSELFGASEMNTFNAQPHAHCCCP